MVKNSGIAFPMTNRQDQIKLFLAQTDWSAATIAPLAGDASNRRYERLTNPDGTTAVLMDAPPDTGETVQPFVQIAQHLTNQGFSAPRILAQETKHGLLLIEDLGDDLFARIIPTNPQLETPLYQAACDVLIQLHQTECPPLINFDPALMTEQAGLVFTSYQQRITGQPLPDALARFQSELFDVLTKYTTAKPVMILRDYHAENLIWLPKRTGTARVGLLDFQDAVAGHPAYDLASLLQDIRRDVSPQTETDTIRHYLDQTGTDEQQFSNAYAVLGVQRNLRILGVFTRLSVDYGKPHYISMIPRVWRHIVNGLRHPALAGLSDILIPTLPEPTPQNLQHLRAP